jgi:ribosomal protein S27E
MADRDDAFLDLIVARNWPDNAGCMHKRIRVDEALDSVICGDCGAGLSPLGILKRFAKEQSVLKYENERRVELEKRLDAKLRVKCQHCGKMTKVRP